MITPTLHLYIEDTHPRSVAAPVDSDTHPIAVLIMGDDLAVTACGTCHTPAPDWPRPTFTIGAPGAMFHADLHCSDCMPRAYLPDTGERVYTLTANPC